MLICDWAKNIAFFLHYNHFHLWVITSWDLFPYPLSRYSKCNQYLLTRLYFSDLLTTSLSLSLTLSHTHTHSVSNVFSVVFDASSFVRLVWHFFTVYLNRTKRDWSTNGQRGKSEVCIWIFIRFFQLTKLLLAFLTWLRLQNDTFVQFRFNATETELTKNIF